jgi:tetratricopeptide (TPR) repeat protein
MNRRLVGLFCLSLLALFPICAWAQAPIPAHPKPAAAQAPIPAATAVAQKLFDTFPVSTHSEEARKLVETAIDQYENYLDHAVDTARKAAAKDSQFALAYAVWSLAAHRKVPAPAALLRAEALAPHATPEEKLLVGWMASVQKSNTLPAIAATNELLARYPEEKHVLLLTARWLQSQQDYDRSRNLLEKSLNVDPDFAPALNELAYVYMEADQPDSAKAIALLRHYAAIQPNQPNPEDSLGELLRISGDDTGSLQHYSAALKIDPGFFSSQLGLGDTYALMGNYSRARAEYDKAIAIATNQRDRFDAETQKVLVYFWEGHASEARNSLDALRARARAAAESYGQFEIGFSRALLAEDSADELAQLKSLDSFLRATPPGMTEADRNASVSVLWREKARAEALAGHTNAADQAVRQLSELATHTHDLGIKNTYESARGYVLFAKGDFAGAAEAFSADEHDPLVLRQLILAQEKLGNSAAAGAARSRLRYHRAPSLEWFLASQP